MSQTKPQAVKQFVYNYSCFFILLLLIIIAAILSPVFFTWGNICNVARQQVPVMLVAIGALLVIQTGGIDLSSGAILAVSNVVLAYLITKVQMVTFGGVFLAMLIAIIIGVAIGGFNGVIISYMRMPAFIATLATMTMARGVAYIITRGSPIRLPVDEADTPGSAALFKFGQSGDPFIGLPQSVWIVIVVIIFFWFLMKYTTFGRLVIATGSNESATRLAGINVKRYKFSVYAISGALAGAAGILMTARAGIATPTAGSGFELDAIAAVVIGGAALSGGKGKVTNTIVGVFIIALIGNIMNLLSVPAYPQQIIQGAIIIIAVLLNNATKEK